jgi:hypothetical protein
MKAAFNGAIPDLAANRVSGNQAPDNPQARLIKLKGLLDSGLITSQEYDAKKSDILAKM